MGNKPISLVWKYSTRTFVCNKSSQSISPCTKESLFESGLDVISDQFLSGKLTEIEFDQAKNQLKTILKYTGTNRIKLKDLYFGYDS